MLWDSGTRTSRPSAQTPRPRSTILLFTSTIREWLSLEGATVMQSADITALIFAAIPMRSSPTSRPSTASVSPSVPLRKSTSKLINLSSLTSQTRNPSTSPKQPAGPTPRKPNAQANPKHPPTSPRLANSSNRRNGCTVSRPLGSLRERFQVV